MFTILIACATSYQNRESEIYIPLDCFIVMDYFLSNGDDRTAIAILGWGQAPPPAQRVTGSNPAPCL